MFELKPWAEVLCLILLCFTFHFAGWALAAPMGWKLWTGVIGMGTSITLLTMIALISR